ncbi:hypothetical protein TrST_g12223 [Triparma strigata]|uniref:Uncharacterized protein n=1 Tax=Triparma strigata TaxID=1606541 RepID=A0A9W7BWQ7_9STRA|nr:hypothetical protein TrST_g12223 [Triparma strigata]
MSFEEAKQILQMEDNGTSLYDHLSQVLLKVITEKPGDAVTSFENLSIGVKGEKVTLPPAPDSSAEASGPVLDWSTKTAALFVKPDEAPEGVPGPDLMADAGMYEWAGVSFGKTETYRLYLSIKKFCETLDAGYQAVKFWGKVTSRDGDYYVCYGKTPENPEDMDATKMEGTEGANKYTYFVTKGVSSPWVALPNVTMAQIVTAGKIRRLLTGSLDAAVPSYPPFPGNEANLLRAMIAQITADCAIAPSGTFEADDEGLIEPVKNDDGDVDPPKKECEELLSKDAWQHYELRLNTLGRCTKLPEPEDADDYEPPEGDEVPEPLGACGEEEGTDEWSMRPCPGGAGQTAGSYAKAVSLTWPGAYAVAGGKSFVNVYVGNGLKYSNVTYTPPLPAGIGKEWSVPEEEADAEVEPGTFPLEGKDVIADPTPPAEEEDE